jgi:hypothetical protein
MRPPPHARSAVTFYDNAQAKGDETAKKRRINPLNPVPVEPLPASLNEAFVLALICLVKILGAIVKPAPIIIAGNLLKVVPWGTPENPKDLKLVSIRALATTL